MYLTTLGPTYPDLCFLEYCALFQILFPTIPKHLYPSLVKLSSSLPRDFKFRFLIQKDHLPFSHFFALFVIVIFGPPPQQFQFFMQFTMAPTATSQPSITYYLKASNAIPVDSPAEARRHIISFLLSCTQENLLLSLSWDNFTKEIRDILQKGSEKRLCQWEYDPEYEILKVKAMGSPLHAALNSCIFRSFITAHRTTLTADEAKCIVINPLPVLLSRPLNPGEKLGEKPAAWTKHPDNLIYFNDIEAEEQFLQIVVEIGFSESYHDLVRDASQWLLRSGGETKVVIIAKIDEDKRQRAIHQKTEQFTCTRDMLVTKYGDAMSQEAYDIEETADGIQNSSPALYKAVKSEVIASDWVGQISVYLEVWELRDGYPALRGPRIVGHTLMNDG